MGVGIKDTASLIFSIIFLFGLCDISNGFGVGRFDPAGTADEVEETEPFMDHGNHGNGTGGGMDHSMKMYFHASAMSMILFKTWMTHNWQQMLGSCVGLFFIAVFYEGLKIGRELLQKRMSPKVSGPEIYPVTEFKTGEHSRAQSATFGTNASVASRIFNLSHIIQTLLHFIQVWISFALMLVFMTYNVWLCLAVTLGAAVGYFAFAWVKTSTSDTNEHCN